MQHQKRQIVGALVSQAVFRAAYSNLTFVRSRKVASISLELPIEQADAFIAAFGSPNPAEEKWVAIARLVEQQAEEQPDRREHHAWTELRPSAQAAIRCGDPMFWQFLVVTDKAGAVEKVRWACDVKSRSELDRNYDAQTKWEEMDEQFMEWKRRRKL